jgi:hypothetical protein
MSGSEPDSCKRGPSGKAQRVFSALLPHRPSPRRPHASSVAKFPGFPVKRAHWSIAGSSTRRRRRPDRRSPAPSGDRWMGAGWILWSRRKHCDAGRRATGERRSGEERLETREEAHPPSGVSTPPPTTHTPPPTTPAQTQTCLLLLIPPSRTQLSSLLSSHPYSPLPLPPHYGAANRCCRYTSKVVSSRDARVVMTRICVTPVS